MRRVVYVVGGFALAAAAGVWASRPATETGLVTAGGSDTQVQYNDGGSALGGAAQLVYDDADGQLLVGSDADDTDFPYAQVIAAQGDSTNSNSNNMGAIGEAVAGDTRDAYGVVGGGLTSGALNAFGVAGAAKVTASTDSGIAVGVVGDATDTHAGSFNIGVMGNASGAAPGNYAFYVFAGDIFSGLAALDWDLDDAQASALSFDAAGAAGILEIETTDNNEQVKTSKGLKLGAYTGDPCGGLDEGSVFYNDTGNYLCYCDGTNDVQAHDPTTACF